MTIEATVIKRGKSLGIILPEEVVKHQNIKPGDVLFLPGITKKQSL
ncbi:hypothetical protein HYY73_01915 [Candidatus Woesearchaeota archaeon]|nr:hypothetical protein [Candidatus Woesearchaeota archaeon]